MICKHATCIFIVQFKQKLNTLCFVGGMVENGKKDQPVYNDLRNNYSSCCKGLAHLLAEPKCSQALLPC